MRKFNFQQDIRVIMLSSAAVMIAYFVIFGLTHSLLADPRVKRAVRHAIGEAADRWYRLVYVILSAIAVLPFFYILAFMPDRTLYVVPAPWKWLMVAGQAVSVIAVVAALKQTGFFYFFGL